MIKIGKIQIVLIVAVIIVVWYLISNNRFASPESTSDLVSFVKINKSKFLDLQEIFDRAGLSDSNFYAEHRFREDSFTFWSLEGRKRGTTFQLEPAKYDSFKRSVLALNIKNIWKYPDENFYTLVIRGMDKVDDKRLFVLVLRREASHFKPVDESGISSSDTTSTVEDFPNAKHVLMIDKQIWIQIVE